MEEAIKALLRVGGEHLQARYERWKAVDSIPPVAPEQQKGQARSCSDSCSSNYSKWSTRSNPNPVWVPNSMTVPLPNAPSLNVYCLYGVGIKTERAYHYIVDHEDALSSESSSHPNGNTDSSDTSKEAGSANWLLDTSVHDPEHDLDSYSDTSHST
eukprot:gene13788-19697_t